MSNTSKGLPENHGSDLFHARHKDQHGKHKGTHAVAANHRDPLKQSKQAVSEPVAPRGNTPLGDGVALPAGLPVAETLPIAPAHGRSVYSPENYREGRAVPAGETLLGPKHNNRPKQRVQHFQSAENTAPHKTLKHHDRNEDGTNPLHGKVRSGKKPAAPLASELRSLEKKLKGGRS